MKVCGAAASGSYLWAQTANYRKKSSSQAAQSIRYFRWLPGTTKMLYQRAPDVGEFLYLAETESDRRAEIVSEYAYS
jgi:hypothetical protein